MSIPITVATAIEKAKIASTTPFLVALDIKVIDPNSPATPVETLRIVNNAEPITWNGSTYAAASFDLKIKYEAGAQPSLSLSIVDISRALQARMQAYGGGVGFLVTVSVLNALNLHRGAEISENFEVIGANAKDYRVTFTIGAENSLSKNFPRRIQTRDFCPWRYKSADCGYAGAMPSCDFTLGGPNGCAAHSNTINFGGFPGLNVNGRAAV